MVKPNYPVRPDPMPDIRAKMTYADDLLAAAQRVKESWNKSQLQDALRSVQFYVDKMK